MNTVNFASRAFSQLINPGETDALISINEPVNNDVLLHSGWKPEQLLRLSFHDVDPAKHQDFIDSGEYTAMTEDQARQIVAFVESLPPKTNLTVACLAGVSRSAGVAKAIAERYNLTFNHDYSLYNRYVYRLVSDAFKKGELCD